MRGRNCSNPWPSVREYGYSFTRKEDRKFATTSVHPSIVNGAPEFNCDGLRRRRFCRADSNSSSVSYRAAAHVLAASRESSITRSSGDKRSILSLYHERVNNPESCKCGQSIQILCGTTATTISLAILANARLPLEWATPLSGQYSVTPMGWRWPERAATG